MTEWTVGGGRRYYVAYRVATDGHPEDSAKYTPVGPNQPLSLKIRSIYPGTQDHGGQLLVASSVRNPSLFDAQPLAMHYVFEHVTRGQLARPRADQDGSDVIYYSPAVIEPTLDISLRLAFDDFDADRYHRWVEVFAKAAGLPVFALGFAAGLGGAAAARGIIYAAQKTVDLGIDLWDKHRDDSNDWYSTWKLNISDAGLNRAESGWLVFFADNAEPDAVGRDLLTKNRLYVINRDDGTLRRRQAPHEVAALDEPYVVAFLSGAKDPGLESWTRGAVSAAIADRFLTSGLDAARGIGDILEVYNDVVMARKINALDKELADPDVMADAVATTELTERRKALLKNVLDRELRETLRS